MARRRRARSSSSDSDPGTQRRRKKQNRPPTRRGNRSLSHGCNSQTGSETPDSDDDIFPRNAGASIKPDPFPHQKRSKPSPLRKKAANSQNPMDIATSSRLSKNTRNPDSEEEHGHVSKKIRKAPLMPSAFNSKQISPSNSKRKYADLPNEQTVNRLVNNCIYFLLISNQKGYPIRRADISKHVFGENFYPTAYKFILVKVNTALQQVFGLELIEFENQKGCYMIINKELRSLEFAKFSVMETAQRGLLMFLLTLIYMNGNALPESVLFLCLKRVDIHTEDKCHPLLGDCKKLLTAEFVRKMYLEYKCVDKEQQSYEFKWGRRAKQEVHKVDLFAWACKVSGKRPADWAMQHKEVRQSTGLLKVTSSGTTVS